MLSGFHIAEAHRMAALALGWEDICARLSIRDDARCAQVRRIVLRKARASTPIFKLFSDARGRQNARPRIRQRQEASTANRDVPITLPPISILRDEA